MKQCVETLVPQPGPLRKKILLGLNFYGYDFSSGPEGKIYMLYMTHIYHLTLVFAVLAVIGNRYAA
jgi:hypothetical protein